MEKREVHDYAVGERFLANDVLIETVAGDGCNACALSKSDLDVCKSRGRHSEIYIPCGMDDRRDGKQVVFKRVSLAATTNYKL